MGWFQGLFQKNNPASPPPGPPHQSRGLLAWAKARLRWAVRHGWTTQLDSRRDHRGEKLLGPSRYAAAPILALPRPHRGRSAAAPSPQNVRFTIRQGRDTWKNSRRIQPGLASAAIHQDPWDQKIANYSEWLFTDRTSVADLIWEVFVLAMIEGYWVSEYDTQIERDGDWKGKVAVDSLKSLDVGNDVALQKDPRNNVVLKLGSGFQTPASITT